MPREIAIDQSFERDPQDTYKLSQAFTSIHKLLLADVRLTGRR
jgi:hypothetical protein